MNIKKITMLSLLLFTITACAGGEGNDPMQETSLSAPMTESGFYENSSSVIGQQFLTEVNDTILFSYNSQSLTAEAKKILNKQADFILKNPKIKIILEGHADERGTREYNLALGEKRATTVKNYLMSCGVPVRQLQVISYGKERPVVDLHISSAWSKNRRAVTVIM